MTTNRPTVSSPVWLGGQTDVAGFLLRIRLNYTNVSDPAAYRMFNATCYWAACPHPAFGLIEREETVVDSAWELQQAPPPLLETSEPDDVIPLIRAA